MTKKVVAVAGLGEDHGFSHYLTHDGNVFCAIAGAYAPWAVDGMNRVDRPLKGSDALAALMRIIVEQNNMLVQAIDSRERDQFTGKQSDDSKRAMQLLARAGEIASKA